MKKLKYTVIVIILCLVASSCGKDEDINKVEVKTVPVGKKQEVPGVVLGHSAKSTKVYLASPSICILDNGDYLASFDFKPASSDDSETAIMKSIDKGESWTRISTIKQQFYSQLFVHNGILYTMGTSKYAGTVNIRKSTDGGITWSNITDSSNGLILSENQYATAPTPVIVHNGRVWRTMEDNKGGGDGTWGHSFRTFIMSAPVDADLLKASSWTVSSKLARSASYLNGDFGGWLEGSPVVTPEGNVVNILRVNYEVNYDELAAIVSVSADGTTLSFNPNTDFINFPGGCKKFVVRYDNKTNKYWALSNYSPDSQKGYGDVTIERTRNTLALLSSTNLRSWNINGIVLHHPDRLTHGFQYPDFQFEDNDIIFLSRTAYDDGVGGADNQHNANFITFHRIENYQNYKTPDLWKNLLP